MRLMAPMLRRAREDGSGTTVCGSKARPTTAPAPNGPTAVAAPVAVLIVRRLPGGLPSTSEPKSGPAFNSPLKNVV